MKFTIYINTEDAVCLIGDWWERKLFSLSESTRLMSRIASKLKRYESVKLVHAELVGVQRPTVATCYTTGKDTQCLEVTLEVEK